MDPLFRYEWASTGDTGPIAAVELPISAAYTVMYVDCSTLATTNSFIYESAQESTGPWFTEGSTTISTVLSTRFAMRVTGPVGPWVRPRLREVSTGQYHIILIGVG